MKSHPQHFISKLRRSSRVGITIGIDLGDIWSHYCTLNEDGEVVDRGRFRTNPSGVDKRFRNLERVRVAMETGTHSIWVSEQIQELGHEVIVAKVRELRAISHSNRKSDQVDAEKIARYARLDPEILRPIAHRNRLFRSVSGKVQICIAVWVNNITAKLCPTCVYRSVVMQANGGRLAQHIGEEKPRAALPILVPK